MKGSASLAGPALRGLRGKSLLAPPKARRKSVIRVSTISYNQTPEKASGRRRLNRSIINTRIESQKEFESASGPNIKKQIVYTKRGQEIMDSLISTGKARIADQGDLRDIIQRKRSGAPGFGDSPYAYPVRGAPEAGPAERRKYTLAHSKLEPRPFGAPDAHRRAKTHLEPDLGLPRARSPSPDQRTDFDGFREEQVVHERWADQLRVAALQQRGLRLAFAGAHGAGAQRQRAELLHEPLAGQQVPVDALAARRQPARGPAARQARAAASEGALTRSPGRRPTCARGARPCAARS